MHVYVISVQVTLFIGATTNTFFGRSWGYTRVGQSQDGQCDVNAVRSWGMCRICILRLLYFYPKFSLFYI